ncbi:hypothetical protein M758_1G216100 [Ceratodon purpureus]|uniref:Uncharacterized protein n=1 Tax=Ceratodon purpureus TaxID=3225 RepID=A0A8T0J9L0_CERPU|nr:hypothetical protein KC19_1G204100 [Ceratodon purpureus]KAG0630954.1 hypothetical protein M758_1G216100 [Ceratodon purpureus]
MDPQNAPGQSRIGIEGRGGTTIPGNMASRSTFRYIFVGGMVAAGIAWYASAHGYLGSAGDKLNQVSRGGSKPPAGTDKVDNAASATEGTSPTGQAHSGMAQGASEGKKMK